MRKKYSVEIEEIANGYLARGGIYNADEYGPCHKFPPKFCSDVSEVADCFEDQFNSRDSVDLTHEADF